MLINIFAKTHPVKLENLQKQATLRGYQRPKLQHPYLAMNEGWYERPKLEQATLLGYGIEDSFRLGGFWTRRDPETETPRLSIGYWLASFDAPESLPRVPPKCGQQSTREKMHAPVWVLQYAAQVGVCKSYWGLYGATWP